MNTPEQLSLLSDMGESHRPFTDDNVIDMEETRQSNDTKQIAESIARHPSNLDPISDSPNIVLDREKSRLGMPAEVTAPPEVLKSNVLSIREIRERSLGHRAIKGE